MTMLRYLSGTFMSKSKISICALLLCAGLSHAQSCKAELSVARERNYDSAGENGALFEMELKNNGSSQETFSIETAFLTESCANSSLKTNAANVKLDIIYPNIGNKEVKLTNISVKAGETYKFKMQLNVPTGTPVKRWSCIEVSAVSKNCKTAVASTVLHVYVPDNTEQ